MSRLLFPGTGNMTQTSTNTLPGSGNALSARVSNLCRQFSLSEVARRSGTPVSSVHRYVGGARVPAEFCAALVQGLGVNPAWLLLGEGAPMLADVPQRTAKVAGGMLEIIEAMNAVAHMRLGSLAGKENRKVLRELDEAMKRHENLRGKLNEHVGPVVKELLQGVATALERRELNRANELHAALGQLMRFCDDLPLRRGYDSQSAALAYAAGRRHEAVEIQRRGFMALLGDARASTDEILRHAHNLAASMAGIGMNSDAMATARAALDLVEARRERPPMWHVLQGLLGLMELEFGSPATGLPRLTRAMAEFTTEQQAPLASLLRMAAAFEGLGMRVQAILAQEPLRPSSLTGLIQFSLWEESLPALEAIIKAGKALGHEPWPNTHLNGEQAEMLVTILKRKRKGPPPQSSAAAEARCRGMVGSGEFLSEIYLAQRERLAGRIQECARACEAAQRVLDNEPPSVGHEVLALAMHHRNWLYADPNGEHAKKAIEFFTEMRAKGYACFAGFPN